MSYEAPQVTEVGNVHGLTLGNDFRATYKDNTNWFAGGDPAPSSPVGSR